MASFQTKLLMDYFKNMQIFQWCNVDSQECNGWMDKFGNDKWGNLTAFCQFPTFQICIYKLYEFGYHNYDLFHYSVNIMDFLVAPLIERWTNKVTQFGRVYCNGNGENDQNGEFSIPKFYNGRCHWMPSKIMQIFANFGPFEWSLDSILTCADPNVLFHCFRN